jgi:hypothetical protein
MLAALLKWPQATFASKVEFDKAARSVKVSSRSDAQDRVGGSGGRGSVCIELGSLCWIRGGWIVLVEFDKVAGWVGVGCAAEGILEGNVCIELGVTLISGGG